MLVHELKLHELLLANGCRFDNQLEIVYHSAVGFVYAFLLNILQ